MGSMILSTTVSRESTVGVPLPESTSLGGVDPLFVDREKLSPVKTSQYIRSLEDIPTDFEGESEVVSSYSRKRLVKVERKGVQLQFSQGIV